MDLETLEVRLNAVLTRGSFRSSRYSWASSVALPTYNSEQPGMEVTDSNIQHGKAVSGSINPSLHARDISYDVFYSQGELQTYSKFSTASSQHNFGFFFNVWLILAGSASNGHPKFPANFARSSAEILVKMTKAAPSVSGPPKCSQSFSGDFSGGVHTSYTKDHFRGKLFYLPYVCT
jgi:hypothetical protein